LPLIPLNRQFIEWRNTETDELSDPDVLSRLGMHDGAKSWDDLLKRLGAGRPERTRAVARITGQTNETIDAIEPETFH
jgi:hypothetical protein